MVSQRYYRKVIRIKAEDSPNVRLALAQQRQGLVPTNEVLVPGVLTWREYRKRRLTWDKIRQCIGLDAEFYEGVENLLFPPEWLNRAEQIARDLIGKGRQSKVKAIGVDPGEGGDDTAMACSDEYGLIELTSEKTPNTNVIVGKLIAMMTRHGVKADRIAIDRGGGGKQLMDRMHEKGHKGCYTVAFGSPVNLEPKRGTRLFEERKDVVEDRYVYVRRRAEMYHALSLLLDPGENEKGWGIPPQYTELRRQLAPIPRTYDGEGRLYLLPKNRRDANDKRPCLTDLIGCSPDEADAVVLSVHAMLNAPRRATAGSVGAGYDRR